MPIRAYDRFSPATVPGPYRVQDYLELTDPEERCELLRGCFFMSPSPSVAHQVIVTELAEFLSACARASGDFVTVSPIDVVLSSDTVVQPDIVYVTTSNRSIVGEARIEGSPDILIEVLSPGTARRDRIEKLSLYRSAGVHEYWLIDPAGRTFEFLELTAENAVIRLPHDDLYESAHLPQVRVELATFWERVAQMLGDSAPG